jgi:hypothetical protein
MSRAIVINLCAGPGAGKSTMAAAIFSELKWHGVNCELATEYAKDRVWQEDFGVFECQPYVFGKQLLKVQRLVNKVDVIITDSPLIFSIMYNNSNLATFAPFVLEAFNQFDNMNYVLQRKKDYNPKGRMQTEDQAKELDIRIKDILSNHLVPFKLAEGSKDGVQFIVKDILERLGKE